MPTYLCACVVTGNFLHNYNAIVTLKKRTILLCHLIPHPYSNIPVLKKSFSWLELGSNVVYTLHLVVIFQKSILNFSSLTPFYAFAYGRGLLVGL